MNEVDTWQPIVGYEGRYAISTAYQVASLPRKGRLRMRILKQSLDGDGRPCVNLYFCGKRTHFKISHLMADAFLPPKSSDDQVLRHLNDDPTDNRIENLAWGTQKDNMADSLHNGTRPRGITHGMAKLTEDNVREIRRLYATGVFTQQELALRFGVSCRMIRYIIRNENWKHVV